MVAARRSGCKPRDRWRIGTEHEKLGFNRRTLRRLSYDEISKAGSPHSHLRSRMALEGGPAACPTPSFPSLSSHFHFHFHSHSHSRSKTSRRASTTLCRAGCRCGWTRGSSHWPRTTSSTGERERRGREGEGGREDFVCQRDLQRQRPPAWKPGGVAGGASFSLELAMPYTSPLLSRTLSFLQSKLGGEQPAASHPAAAAAAQQLGLKLQPLVQHYLQAMEAIK